MNILYEDKQLIVCLKPVGILSQPGKDGQGVDMITQLKAYRREKKETDYIGLVHRLDRNVGGVMVFSKQPSITGKLSAAIQERNFTKEYLAVVHGQPEPMEGELHDLLFKDASKNKSYVVKRKRKGVKDASLAYRTIDSVEESSERLSLVRIHLHTGRTHQIRVQFSSRKMPLLGDGKYGSKDNFGQIALWAFRLAFTHPLTKKPIDITQLPQQEYPWNLFSYEKLSIEAN